MGVFSKAREIAAAAANTGHIDRSLYTDGNGISAFTIYDRACEELRAMLNANAAPGKRVSEGDVMGKAYERQLSAVMKRYESLALGGWATGREKATRRYQTPEDRDLAADLIAFCGSAAEKRGKQPASLVMNMTEYKSLIAQEGRPMEVT